MSGDLSCLVESPKMKAHEVVLGDGSQSVERRCFHPKHKGAVIFVLGLHHTQKASWGRAVQG